MQARLPFVVSAVFHYLGPAFAVLLFARVDVLGVAWLRIAAAAVGFAAWRRPWRRGDLGARTLIAWGAVLAVMNCCFYLAISRLPLGTVAAIEFLPVIVLAAIGSRTPRNIAALGLAVVRVDVLAAVAVTPFAGPAALPAFVSPLAVLAGIGVGLSSSVVPYVTDQLAMARI